MILLSHQRGYLSILLIFLQGQKFHKNIADIILKFRNHRIVFVCGIQQIMFRNIWIHESNQSLYLI